MTASILFLSNVMMNQPMWWAAFLGFILVMLAIDLGVFHKHEHVVSTREAMIWVCVWVALALAFYAGIRMGWIGAYTDAIVRKQASIDFLTGYLVELSLSVDNVFVFALLFKYFKVPPIYRHRVLFWGILGALIMRAIMIFAGVALLHRFHWIIYIFGAILIYSGIKMWKSSEVEVDMDQNPVLKLVRRILPVSRGEHGQRFFIVENGKRLATPLFVVLLLMEWTDLVFAVDSIPAVLGITSDAFIVFTSNIMAILGLRSLYFALAGVMNRFHLLHYGLSAILIFIGTKMVGAKFYKIDSTVSLYVVAGILVVSVVASLMVPPPPAKAEEKVKEGEKKD